MSTVDQDVTNQLQPRRTAEFTAMQWEPSDLLAAGAAVGWLMGHRADFHHPGGMGETTSLAIRTPDGEMLAQPGDWILRHADGQFTTAPGESICGRCLGPNRPWSAPSPLWNAVMRGGSINGGPEPHGGIICPSCFMVLAEEADIADLWVLHATRVNAVLETVTPSGRTWNRQTMLWDELAAAKPSMVDQLLRRFLESSRDFERAGFEATEDRDKFPLWERAALTGMCAYLLKSLAEAYPSVAESIAEDLESAAMDGQWLAGWAADQLVGILNINPDFAKDHPQLAATLIDHRLAQTRETK